MAITISSESVTEGHPDKVCDIISDSLLDAFLAGDPQSRVAVETMATVNTVIVAGEVTSKTRVDVENAVRRALHQIGYTDDKYGLDCKKVEVVVKLHQQSPDIAQGVDRDGAGDQGMMYGYASDETDALMPLPILLAHRLAQKLAQVRKDGTIPNLGPDGKTQVSVDYQDGKPLRVSTVVIAQQHTEDVDEDTLRSVIESKVIKPVCGKWIDKSTVTHINATGRFVIGGPAADTGLTGRKIIVDTYGGIGRHGGGAFSGKDPSKVDRSGAYMARYVAKNIVAAGFAKRAEVQLAYVIGQAAPVSVAVDTFGTGTKSNEELVQWVKDRFDLTPKGIIKTLDLRKPIFRQTAAYGHFGRQEFPWEKTIEADS